MKQMYPFQQTAIERMQNMPGALLADECGLGKTITAIELAKWQREQIGANLWRALVVVPLSLRPQWVDVLRDQDPGLEITESNYIPWNYRELEGWFIATYPEFQGGYGHLFSSVLWDILIIDEAHRIKNAKSITAQGLKTLNAARRVALTGTPWERSPGDVWSILNFLRPEEFPSFWTFAKEWLEKEDNYFDAFRYGNALDPEAFAEMLSEFMIRRTKVEVRPDIPDKIISEIRVEMTEHQASLYKQLKSVKDVLVPIEDKELLIQNALTLIVRAQQLSSWPRLLDFDGGSGKLNWLQDFLVDHPTDFVVVFTRFRDLAIWLSEKYKGDLIIGGQENRTGARLTFVTIDSVEGVDGLQTADHAIFLDAHWSTIKMTQAFDRIHRINITTVKNIYLLHSCYEDRMVLNAINAKWTEEELIHYYMKNFEFHPE